MTDHNKIIYSLVKLNAVIQYKCVHTIFYRVGIRVPQSHFFEE